MPQKVLLEVQNLVTQFDTQEGTVHAVNGVSFTVHEGEILALVGESGCGKSVTMLSIMGLIPQPPGKIVSGEIIFDGKNLSEMSNKQMQGIPLRFRALVSIIIDEFNILRGLHSLPDRTMTQLKAVIDARIDSGDAD